MDSSPHALVLDAPDNLTTLHRLQTIVEKTGLTLRAYIEVGAVLEEIKPETTSGAKPLFVLLGPHLDDPMTSARQIYRYAPSIHLIFLTSGDDSEQRAYLKSPATMLGSNWTVISIDADTLATQLQDATNTIRQRLRFQSTISNINTQLTTSADFTSLRRQSVSDRFLANFLEQAQDAIIATDINGKIIAWNNAAEALFGLSRSEATGRELHEIADGEWCRQIPILLAAASGPKSGFDRQALTCPRHDGQILNIELSLSMVRETSNEPIGISVIVRDISERKLAAERFRLAIEAAPSGFLMADANGKITLVNSQLERYFGYASDELIGQPIENLLPMSVRNRHPALRNAFLQEPESRPMGNGRDLFAVRRDGTEFPVEVALNPIVTENGIEVLAVIADISERKRSEHERHNLEKQVQQAQKLESLGILAGGIAHDFNNILTGILGNAELMLLRLPPMAPIRDHLEEVQKASLRAAELCKQMLAYSGKGKFVVQALNLNDVIEEMTQLLRISIAKSAMINYRLYAELPSVEADATQIRQIVMNLITNASESIGDKSGVITITTGAIECDRKYLSDTFMDDTLEPGIYVYLEVSDTGCGMDRETQEKIFDPFFSTKFTGRGLGLAAALGIVRGHKGAVKVYSEVGRGTTFKILLPCSDKEAIKYSNDTIDIDTFSFHGTALIIDDEDSVRAVARQTLESTGLKVMTAPDGRAGIELFEKMQDELLFVLLDLTMPHMSGEEVFRRIRLMKPNMPVILTSGYNEQEVTNRFAGKGLAGFIQKPLRPTAFLTTVQQVLQKQKK